MARFAPKALPDVCALPVSHERGLLVGSLAVAGLLHGAGLLAACATPVDTAQVEAERMGLARRYLAASAERHGEGIPADSTAAASAPHGTEGGTGTRAKGEEGSMGAASRADGASLSGFGASRIGTIGHGPGGPAHAPRGPRVVGGTPIIGGGAAELGMIGILHAGGGSGGLATSRIDGAEGWAGPQQQRTNVGAGEWDDNANYREFGRFLAAASGSGMHALDVRDRQFLVVRDVAGKPIPSCDVSVAGAQGGSISLRTMASGRALFFPHAFPTGAGLSGSHFSAYARCGGNAMSAEFALADDGVVELRGKEPRADEAFTVDVGFALDTTGSMHEEIDAVKATLRTVAQSLDGVSLRVGLVEYRDKGDEFVTRVYPMEADVSHFAAAVSRLSAAGGGDTPEAMPQGFHDALTGLEWRPNATARLLFVIGDAPPHLETRDGPDYADDARLAARMGVQVHGIAASGMDAAGQVVFRQISQFTGGTEMFVLRGGAGPQSAGGGDPLASCGGTQRQYRSGNLAALVIGKVTAARRAMNANPTSIAGRGKDESAKPCGERLAQR